MPVQASICVWGIEAYIDSSGWGLLHPKHISCFCLGCKTAGDYLDAECLPKATTATPLNMSAVKTLWESLTKCQNITFIMSSSDKLPRFSIAEQQQNNSLGRPLTHLACPQTERWQKSQCPDYLSTFDTAALLLYHTQHLPAALHNQLSHCLLTTHSWNWKSIIITYCWASP